MQSLEDISVRMLENFMDVPDTAVLGTSAYYKLVDEFSKKYSGYGPVKGGFNTIQIHTSAAMLKVSVSPSVHPEHISIGTITLETMKLLETLGRLDVYNDPFSHGITYSNFASSSASSIFVR